MSLFLYFRKSKHTKDVLIMTPTGWREDCETSIMENLSFFFLLLSMSIKNFGKCFVSNASNKFLGRFFFLHDMMRFHWTLKSAASCNQNMCFSCFFFLFHFFIAFTPMQINQTAACSAHANGFKTTISFFFFLESLLFPSDAVNLYKH